MLISKLNTEINSMKSNHRVILQNNLKDTKEKQSLIRQNVESLKKITKSNEILQIIEYNCESKDFSKLPSLLQVSLPTFSPKPIEKDKLLNNFGDLSPLSTKETVSSLVN